jgi:hypothetical protein
VEVQHVDGLNHLFQPATTTSVIEHAGIETNLEPVVLKRLSGFGDPQDPRAALALML